MTTLDIGVVVAKMRATAAYRHEEVLAQIEPIDETQQEDLCTNLVGRYDNECNQRQYPQINTFLILCAISGTNEKTWDQYYEESHGEGYYTIQIV